MAVSITIDITLNSQSVANNTSNVTVKVNASWTGGSYNLLQKSGWLKIDGTTYNFTNSFNDNQTNSGVKTLYSKTVNIAHNSDGTKTLACSASYTSGVSSGTVGASVPSYKLTTIPRKSSISVSNGTLGTKQTISVTQQATTFTHSIKAVCGSSTLYVKADGSTSSTEAKHNDCSISFTPPLTWASQNTSGTSVSVTFTITTYSGSTNVGSNTKTVSYSIPASVKPSCSVSVSDATNIYNTYKSYVRNLSKVKVTVTPTLSYGSAIKTYKTTANGSTYTSSSFTTGLLSSSGTLNITATVTDNRGRSGSDTESITVLDYNAPVISKLTVHRCNEDGKENDQGEYIQVMFSATITSLNNLNKSSYVLKYKKTSESTYTSVTFNDYANSYSVTDATYVFEADSGSSYDVEIDVADNHNTTTRVTTASTGFTIMHWGSDGRSLGLGKMAELTDVLDIGFQTRFHGGILNISLEPNTDLNDIRTPNTYVGADVSTYNYVNCPLTSGTFTLEVVSMGESGQVKQRLTYCHKTNARAWERIYYSSSWGEWICVSDFNGKLLWTGPYYMVAGHTATLTEPVSKQKNGIVLVFSLYDTETKEAKNQEIFEFFIPKYTVSLFDGKGRNFNLCGMFGNGIKYLYLHDDKIVGHEKNASAMTVGGIEYTNGRYVLRYVIGV